MKMKKTLAWVLSSAMALGLLAGCSGNDANSGSGSGSGSSSSSGSNSTGSDANSGSSSTGSDTNSGSSSSGDVVTLKWVQVGSGMPSNYDAWEANLNTYLEEKIGVHLEMEIVGWGDWDTRRNMIVSTNEPYDILFTNNGTFNNDVTLGAFLDITDMVKTASPDLYSFIPEDYWDACKIDGKIYGVPAMKDSSATQYFVWDKELIESAYPDYANLHTLQEITPALEAAYAAKGESVFILNKGGLDAIYGKRYDDISAGLPAMGVSYTDGSAKVVSVFEQQDVLDDLNTLREWYQAGIINSDANILDEAPSYRPCFVAQGWSGAATTTWGPQMGVDAVAIQWGDTTVSNSTVQGSMSCISAACKNPEKALQLLELVNTDSKVRDALYYGLEGENFEYTADGKVHKINTDWTMAGYTQGTFFNVTTLDTDEFNQWDEVKALNEAAVASPIMGFSLDTTEISNDLSACTAIFTEYRPVLMTGAADPASTIDAMLSALNDAGFQELMAAVQAQIDEWKA